MRVKWIRYSEVLDPDTYHVVAIPYAGEVIGCVRTFTGDTMLVVMLDSGRVMEIAIDQVEREGAVCPTKSE